MICIHTACLPASHPPCTDKEPNPATTVRWDGLVFSPPTKREGVKKGGACLLVLVSPRSTLKLSNEILSRLWRALEAGQYPILPPLIHAPCSFTCTFVSPTSTTSTTIPPPAGDLLYSRNQCNEFNLNFVFLSHTQSPWQILTRGTGYTMQSHHKPRDDVICERKT